MSIIYRSEFSTLWITLQSNEQLGLLDSDYLEDFFGTQGHITLHHIEGDTDYPVFMIEQVWQTPTIPHDVFKGQTALSNLPDGNYEIRARCRDVGGNYTILSSVQNPVGNEQVFSMGFEVRQGDGNPVVELPTGIVALGLMGVCLKRPELSGTRLNRTPITASLTR